MLQEDVNEHQPADAAHKSHRSSRAFVVIVVVVVVVALAGILITRSMMSGSPRYASQTAHISPPADYSLWQNVKSQVDVCNVKSIVQDSGNSYLTIELRREAPDVDASGKQIGVVSKMELHSSDRSRLLDEIKQLKPSCPQDIPYTVSPS